MMRFLVALCLLCPLMACQRISTNVALPNDSYSIVQRKGYGQSSPVLDVVIRNPFAEAICIPRATFDDTVSAIGMQIGAVDVARNQVSDIFPPEFSTKLHADAYYFVAPGRGWKDVVRLGNFTLQQGETYSVYAKWIFYFCSDLTGPAVGRGGDPKRLIKVNVEHVVVTAPW